MVYMTGSSKGRGGNDKLRIRPRFSLRLGIGVRFVSFVVLVALLAGGLVGLTLVTTSRNSLREQVLHNNLERADLAAAFASIYVKTIQAHAQVFALRPDIRQAVLDNDFERAQEALSRFVEIQTLIAGAAILDENAIQRVFSSPGTTSIGQSFADRDYFKQPAATLQSYLDLGVKSRATGLLTIAYGTPIVDDEGKFRGVLSVGIGLSKLSDAIAKMDYGTDTVASLVELRNGGFIIASRDPAMLMTPLSKEDEAVALLLQGKSGTIETTNSGGGLNLVGFAVVPDLQWGVMVITPSKSAFLTIETLTRDAILYTGLIIVFAAFIGVVLVLGVTRPLRRFIEGADEMGRGNLNYDVATKNRDEIGDLSRAFGAMAKNLSVTLVSRDELAKEVVERRKAEGQLKQAMEELKRSNEELQRFAYVASHDLQEPLRMVASYVQLLERRYKDKLDSDANDFIGFAVDGAKRMQNLINDLLAFSRIGSSGKPFEPTSMEQAFGYALDNLQVAIEESSAEVSNDPLPTVLADEGQMIQVFQNLIGNAIKYHGKEPPRIHVSAQQQGREWLFSVRDNGMGIESQYFERIFIIFQRLHGSEYPGTGTGLSISKRIIERHGGRIWVESQPSKGSTFHFSIPIVGGPQA